MCLVLLPSVGAILSAWDFPLVSMEVEKPSNQQTSQQTSNAMLRLIIKLLNILFMVLPTLNRISKSHV